MEFNSTVELGGKTATGVPVPPDVVEALGSGKRPKVVATIGGHSYRTSVAPYGERYFIPLSAANRTAAGVSAGDDVQVTLALDTEPREIAVPHDLATALDTAGVRAAFDTLSYSNRRGFIEPIEAAKKPETRESRIAKAVAAAQARAGK